MLYRLEISNFYSFRHPQIIDLRVGERVPEAIGRLEAIFPGSKERAPRVVAFFGANASGKSTVLRALSFIVWFASESFQLRPYANLPCERFNDAEAAHEPIRLAIEFGGALISATDTQKAPPGQGTWRYELELVNDGDKFVVLAENLRRRPGGRGKWSRVFERARNGGVVAGKDFALAGYAMVTDKVRDNASVISTLAQFDHGPSLRLQADARSVISNILFERTEANESDAIRYYAGNPESREVLNREIQRIDLGIRGMTIVQGPHGPQASFEHQGLQQPMPWALESHGTRSFVRHFPLIQEALRRGGIAIIDEMDISIHPLVLPEIVRWFYDADRNPRGAQLWVTCHAATLLEELMKEEVFFCEKDGHGRSSVYGLQDIQNVRRTDNRYRKYLSGVYGAIPNIG